VQEPLLTGVGGGGGADIVVSPPVRRRRGLHIFSNARQGVNQSR
jgi:hypothetical protein